MNKKNTLTLALVVLLGTLIPQGIFSIAEEAATNKAVFSEVTVVSVAAPAVVSVGKLASAEQNTSFSKVTVVPDSSCGTSEGFAAFVQGGSVVNLQKPASCFNLQLGKLAAQPKVSVLPVQEISQPKVFVLKSSVYLPFKILPFSSKVPTESTLPLSALAFLSFVMVAIIFEKKLKNILVFSVPQLRLPVVSHLRC